MLITKIFRGSLVLFSHSIRTGMVVIGICLLFPVVLSAQPQNPSTIFEEAITLFHNNEMADAEALFEEITGNYCNSPSYAEECVESKVFLSVIKRNERALEDSEKLIESAGDFVSKYLHSDHPVNINLYVETAYLFDDMGDLDKAEEQVNRAVKLVASEGITGIRKANTYLALGYVEDSQGNYKKAIEAYNDALFAIENEERNIRVLKFLAKAYNNAGISYRKLGKVEQAMSHYQLAQQVVEEAYGRDHLEMAFVYNSIGTVYYSKGDYGTAGDYFLQSGQIFEKENGKNHPRTAAALNNAGISYFRLEDYEKAAETLELAQEIKINLLGENHLDTAVGYSNLGSIHLQNENIEQARINYEKSIAVRENIFDSNHPSLIDPHIQLGKLHIKSSNHPEARSYLNTALVIALERLGEDHPATAEIYYELGYSYQEENRLEQAEQNFEKALNMLTEEYSGEPSDIKNISDVSEPLLLISTLNELAEVKSDHYEKQKEIHYINEALKFSRKAAELVDELQTSYQSEASKLNLIEKNYSIYTNAIKALAIMYRETSDTVWLDEMFLFAEKSKAKIALELFQNMEAKNLGGVPQHILQVEKEMNEKLTGYFQQLHLEKEKGLDAEQEIISAYQDSLFNARLELNRFTENLEQDYPSYFKLKYDRKLTGREKLNSLLTDKQALLTYTIADENIYALLICQGNISFYDLGSAKNLKDQVHKIRKTVTAGDTQGYAEVAYSLYQKLVAPVRRNITTEDLIIIPDQVLHYLPFEMLLVNSANGLDYHQFPFLVKDFKITYAPSATLLDIMTAQKPESPRNLLAMAPFHQGTVSVQKNNNMESYFEELTPLPLTRYETREIEKIFTKKRSFKDYFLPEQIELLIGGEATKSRLLNEPLHKYGFIHLATHAFVHESNPGFSGIALQGDKFSGNSDGIMYVSDIYNLQMNADLLVLGACETGLGSMYRGEGIIGFTRAFIYAGAANLMVSMWKVNDRSTANLMIEFYSNTRQGLSYGESLRNAKLSLIEQPETAAPRNWAAFILNGR